MNTKTLQAEVLNSVEYTVQFSSYSVEIKSGKQIGKSVIARWYFEPNKGVDLPHNGDLVKLKVSPDQDGRLMFFLHPVRYNAELENLTLEDF